MGQAKLGRIVAVAIAFLFVAAIAGLVAPRAEITSVRAQAQPTVAGSVIQLPPSVPGLDSIPAQPGQATIPEAVATTGTPVAADPGTVAAPTDGGTVSATLSGSDIAVSSVGGSYERDVPNKRRGDRDRRR